MALLSQLARGTQPTDFRIRRRRSVDAVSERKVISARPLSDPLLTQTARSRL